MRVAWDLQAVTGPKPTGLGISVGFLKRAFEEHCPGWELVGLRPNEEDRALIGVPDRLAWEQVRLPARLRETHREQPLNLCYSPALGAPMSSPVPVVAHVHDLIPLHFPQQFSGIAGLYWKKLLPYTWRRCAALTVSNETIAADVAKHLSYDRRRIHVVPYYPDPELAELEAAARARLPELRKYQAPEPLFITLASFEQRKNLTLPLRAVGLLQQRGIRVRLECIGTHTIYTSQLKRAAVDMGITEQIRFPGYLDRKTVVEKLLQCTALLFTSSYEGFGMPPLEAMSLGVPVVLSDIPCHRQVYCDFARQQECGLGDELPAALVGVQDASALAAQMERLVADEEYRQARQRTGLAYSGTFSAQATAEALQQAFESAAG